MQREYDAMKDDEAASNHYSDYGDQEFQEDHNDFNFVSNTQMKNGEQEYGIEDHY